ncbi:MAG: ABC transporter permease subunit [Candidatus Borkfalkiaceae bacterium]|nr:ABC transporter permease subunit [Christensenellaceae bacterium]
MVQTKTLTGKGGDTSQGRLSAASVKGIIVTAVAVVCVVAFFFLGMIQKSQMDLGAIYGYSFLKMLRIAFSREGFFAYDPFGTPLDISFPATVLYLAVAMFLCLSATAVFLVLRYTCLKKVKNISFVASLLCMADAAFILAVYLFLMFYEEPVTRLYGDETVKYYRSFECTPLLLVLAIAMAFAAMLERKIGTRTVGLIKRFLPIYGFMAIPLVFIFIFNLYPIVIQSVLSFKDHTMSGTVWNGEWVGLKHFRTIFTDPSMLAIIGRTLYISVLRLVVNILPSLILSVCLYDLKSKTMRSVFQNIVYIPHFFSWVVVYAITYALLSPKGLVNNLLGTTTDFIVSEKWFMPIVILTAVWKELGWGTILYLAALSGVDTSLFEAAKIDGASPLQRIWHVTLPGIKGTIIFLTVMSLGSILKGAGGEQLLLFYSATTKQQALVIDTWLVWSGKNEFQYSLGAAMGFFQSAIGMIMVLGSNYLSRKLCDVSMW